jgi:disulfide bond formation protein DsbB
MKRINLILIAIIACCLSLLSFALYLQIGLDMLPCPLCVGQRYAFALIAVFCGIALLLPKIQRYLSGLAVLSAIGGAGTATYQLWIISQPHASCGIDPLTAPLNDIFMAKIFPLMFHASGLCETPYDPILGLSIPMWALIWFVILGGTALYTTLCAKAERKYFK